MPVALRASVLTLVGVTVAVWILTAVGVVPQGPGEVLVRVGVVVGVAIAIYAVSRWPERR